MAQQELDPKYDQFDYPTVAQTAQSGHPGHLTEEQKAQVAQLRLMLEAEGYTKRLDTLTMLRFLRARKFDVNLAKQMFVEFENWRKETKLDETIPTWEYPEKEEVFKFYPQYYHKTDKDGRPVYIEALGGIDLNAMYKITTAERMLTNLAVEYEKCADPRFPACSRKYNHLVETCCTIMDLKGVTITRVPQVYNYVKQASVISQNYYPERLGKLYMINAPWGFSTVWSVVKGWLDPVTVQKINILGSGYQKELLNQIPAENLPKSYGGKCECQGGCHLSDAGPWHEKEWTKEPWWAKPQAAAPSAVIENKGDETVTAPAAAPAGTAVTTDAAADAAKAPAAA
ncbi:Sec14 cytosolic factor [Colletotrichum plurivorum]|uniref:Sec14 cytosolic factor n=1 Tax=Colletotrichum plurivorum TaxID=2175906 RepID=A0A8H6K6B1_9PEZI|nr:Sec14 cytosolic factor [Colletotrichum plurivorum]